MSVVERLFRGLVIDPSGCVLWTGCSNGKGYGRITLGSGDVYVHRLMYELFAGPVPDGMQLDHLCRVRNCANVAHLEPVTASENVQRSWDARGTVNDLRTRMRVRRNSAAYRARQKAALS